MISESTLQKALMRCLTSLHNHSIEMEESNDDSDKARLKAIMRLYLLSDNN